MANILIVDDEPTILELFRFVFEDGGHNVVLAKNGLEALEELKRSVPDFIVLDVSMPEMTGKEFAVELSRMASRDARFANIPFVVMTGENFMDEDLNRVFSRVKGFVCFFPKMVPPEKVLEKAVEVMSKR